ncbi:hypothetical protein MBLNU13_g03078t1 [Cladosporium sp. NU13]
MYTLNGTTETLTDGSNYQSEAKTKIYRLSDPFDADYSTKIGGEAGTELVKVTPQKPKPANGPGRGDSRSGSASLSPTQHPAQASGIAFTCNTTASSPSFPNSSSSFSHSRSGFSPSSSSSSLSLFRPSFLSLSFLTHFSSSCFWSLFFLF